VCCAGKITRETGRFQKAPYNTSHSPLYSINPPTHAGVCAPRRHTCRLDIGGDLNCSRKRGFSGVATPVCSRHRSASIFSTQHVHVHANLPAKWHVCAMSGWGAASRSVGPRPHCSGSAGEMVFRHHNFAHESPGHAPYVHR